MTSKKGASVLVFDTGPLRQFALRGWLGVLRFVADERQVVIPESVEEELRNQTRDKPVLNQIFDEGWIHVDRSSDLGYLRAFADYEARLVAGGRNRGECGVLALGRVRGLTLVLDDAVPRKIASEEGFAVTGTLGLLCEAIRRDHLTVGMVEQLADDLLSGDYRLPFGPGGFRKWASEQGML